MADVVLVTMPWDVLGSPSLALGILHQLLLDAGISVATRSPKLWWMERLLEAGIGIDRYDEIAGYGGGLGDYVFAEPPMASPDGIARYAAALRAQVAGSFLARVEELRRLAPRFLDECAAALLALRPRVVGFTTMFSQTMASLGVARRLKALDPSVRVVLGGSNCEGPMGAALARCFPWIDVVVRGEAEAVAPAIFGALLAGEPVPAAPAGTPVPMDAVPTPHYDDFFAELDATSFADLMRATSFISFEAARGCWWGEVSHCTFCGLNGGTMAFRSKSAARVVDEILTLARRHQVLDLHAVDNIFDHRYFDELLPQLARAGLDLDLFWEVKSNLKKRELAALRRAGVARIQPGIESLSTEILALMGKGVTAWQNLRLIKWCAELGIGVEWNLLHGFPREPEAAYDEMAALIPSLHHLPPPRFEPVVVHRFSPYQLRPEAYGLALTGPAWHYGCLFDVPADALADLAYHFEHAHLDGRDPERYVGGCRRAVAEWRAAHAAGAELTWRRGPGFVLIRDGRAGRGGELVDTTLEGDEAAVYAACDDGGRLTTIAERAGVSPVAARAILDELVAARLVLREGERYLGLALRPGRVEEEAADAVPLNLVRSGRAR